MTPVDDLTAEEAREQVKKFRRLLNPVWMQLAYVALGDNERPKDGDAIFSHMGGGCSDWSRFGDFFELMGDPWEVAASGMEAPSGGETEQIAENANCSGSTEGDSPTAEGGDAQGGK